MSKNRNRHRRKSGRHGRFINKRKSANINKKTATDLNTLSTCWKLTFGKWKNRNPPATELDQTFVHKYFNWYTQAKWRRVRASNNFQLLAQNCPEWIEASNYYRRWRGRFTLRLLLHRLCISLNDFHSNQFDISSWYFHVLWRAS